MSVEEIPDYLRHYIAKQDYDLYTPIDQAGWRFIMRISRDFFKEHAHAKYIEGLNATGITTDSIPRISDMDEKLKKFGWRAAAVTGFIPPAVFLEYLSLGILPIACDMRRLEHLDYTPAPDIVHEAAGHAPILADPDYARFLHKFGEIARKAIFAKEDIDVYEAVLHLSEIKENPNTTEQEVAEAYERLDKAQKSVTYTSEASQLSRLGWWSTEYGLVKKGDKYEIYGAGLLSSVGESYNSVHSNVPKMRLTNDCVKVNFDITKPQPQLFYVEDFSELENVIDELANSMAFKTGGTLGLERAKKARTVTTTELDSGLQISGLLENVKLDASGKVSFLKYSGPTQLAYTDVELPGQGADYHVHGFSSPIGNVKTEYGEKPVAELTRDQLDDLGFTPNDEGEMNFVSGIKLTGRLAKVLRRNGKNIILTFENCTVTLNGEKLFDPAWGTFDMACGNNVVSVFGGAADRAKYMYETSSYGKVARPQTSTWSEMHADLIPLYADVRKIRESGFLSAPELSRIERIVSELDEKFPNDWLLRIELIEIVIGMGSTTHQIEVKLRSDLSRISKGNSTIAGLIRRGLAAIRN